MQFAFDPNELHQPIFPLIVEKSANAASEVSQLDPSEVVRARAPALAEGNYQSRRAVAAVRYSIRDEAAGISTENFSRAR